MHPLIIIGILAALAAFFVLAAIFNTRNTNDKYEQLREELDRIEEER